MRMTGRLGDEGAWGARARARVPGMLIDVKPNDDMCNVIGVHILVGHVCRSVV